MTLEHANLQDGLGDAEVRRVKRGPSRVLRRQIRYAVLALVLSGLAFCFVAVKQRDHRVFRTVMSDTQHFERWLQEYVNEWGALPHPAKLPTDKPFLNGNFGIPYPSSAELEALRGQPGPYVVASSIPIGMFTPGRDGVAAIIYERGKLTTKWISLEEYPKQRELRKELAAARP